MFSTFHKAGLQTRHLVKFVGVSRITASRWLNDHGIEPHPQLIGKVSRFLNLVKQAYDAGELPFPPNIAKSDENNYLTGLFRKYLKNQKESSGDLR